MVLVCILHTFCCYEASYCDVDRETLEGVYTGQANGLIKSFTYTNYSYALMQCQSHIGVIVPHNVVNPC